MPRGGNSNSNAARLAQRWAFLGPWLEILDRHIKYKQVAQEEEVWEAERRVLEITLPYHHSPKFQSYTRGEFLYELQEIREALALVSAVAHIDTEAWKFVLNKIWGLKLGKKGSEELEQEIPPRFVLVFDKMANYNLGTNYLLERENPPALHDLVFFCGTNQVEDATPEFLTGLRDIAARAGHKIPPHGKSGLDIRVQVQVSYTDGEGGFAFGDQFVHIMLAEKEIKEEWKEYEQREGGRGVPSGTIRCTFELGPMIAQMTDTYGYYRVAPNLQKAVLQNNVWFEKVTLSPGGGGYEGSENFRQIVTAVFDWQRRNPKRASGRYYADRGAYLRDGSPLQVNHVDFTTYSGIASESLGAIMSALVVNQTTKKFSLRAEMRSIVNGKQWKWLAYGLFSKRARGYSALEYASLNQIDVLSVGAMKSFLAVLNSEHPEEVLCGTPAGVIEERNATLKSGSPIRWYFSQGQLVVDDKHKVITADTAIRCVRTFSDDGESEWVNAMVPGLGRCQVQRDDLIFDLASAIETRPGALKTLTLGFNREEDTYPTTNGLPQFLAAIGSTLKHLTLDGPRADIDENVILQQCPNLHTLSLCGGIVDVQLDFSDYRYDNLPVPELKCNWHDVQALAADLSDTNNPLSKIVRRLRLRLNDKCEGWRRVAGGYDFDKLPEDMKAIMRMLTVNRHLAYLDVLMLTDYHQYGTALKKQHRKPIDRVARLPRDAKLAFLSVVSARMTSAQAARSKRARRPSQSEPSVGGLDQRVISQIFSFAGPPLLRQVYFRTTKRYLEPYYDFYADFYDDSEDGSEDDEIPEA